MIPALTVDFLLNALAGGAVQTEVAVGEEPAVAFTEALQTATSEAAENTEEAGETKDIPDHPEETSAKQQAAQLSPQFSWLPFANLQIVAVAPPHVPPETESQGATEVRQDPAKGVTNSTGTTAPEPSARAPLPSLPQLPEIEGAAKSPVTAEALPAPAVEEKKNADVVDHPTDVAPPPDEAKESQPIVHAAEAQAPAIVKRSLAAIPKLHERMKADDVVPATEAPSADLIPVSAPSPATGTIAVPIGTQIVRAEVEAKAPDRVMTALTGSQVRGDADTSQEKPTAHASGAVPVVSESGEPPQVAAFSGVIRRTAADTEEPSPAAPKTQPPAKVLSQLVTDAPQQTPQSTGAARTAKGETTQHAPDVPALPESPVSQPTQAVTLRLGAGTNERIDVQLQQRGGQMHMAVRTDSPEMAHRLRTDLPELSQSFGESGFRAEIRTNSHSSDGDTSRHRQESLLYEGENGQGRQRRQQKQEQEDEQFNN